MTTENKRAADEAQIRTLIDHWANSLRTKDADRSVSHYAADNVMFVMAPPLQYTPANSPGKQGVKNGSRRG